MNRLRSCNTWLSTHSDVFLDLVRVYLGTGLFVKAFYLLGHRDYLVQVISDSGNSWFAPAAVAQYVIVAHMIGGALLALGMATRLAAIVQLPVLLGAVFYVYLPRMATIEPRQSLEYTALVAFLLVWIAIFGAGRWSVDHWITRKRAAGDVAPVSAPAGHVGG
jgi:putative oxidoreductase